MEFWIRFDSCVVISFLTLFPPALDHGGEAARCRGGGRHGFEAAGQALVAGDDAAAHGAGVHGVRADVQRTLAPGEKVNV